MKLSALKKSLGNHPELTVRFILPTGSKIPPHAHVTEVARIDKTFIDCGGTQRTEVLCRLQTWFADDTDHRLTAGKLFNILELSSSFMESDDMEVDVEHEAPFVSLFPIETAEAQGDTLVIRLGTKHTACLAEYKCLPPALNKFTALPSFQTSAQKCC